MLALLSVSDKRGLVPFAAGLLELGFQILSTGGTLQALQAAGLAATKVSAYTGSPEILGGRVKTLHPKIHGGLLGRAELPQDRAEMEAQGIAPISVLAVNLYPFRQTVASGASEQDVIENIDIGGPALVRAAAKNGAQVTVVVDPEDYPSVLSELRAGGSTAATRARLVRKAFAHTAAYDASIASYLQAQASEPFPAELTVAFQKAQELRYGENPHQRAAFYRGYQAPPAPSLGFAEVLQGKELSYNNLLDLDAALALALEFPERPAAVIIKHNTPCGVALSDVLETAYRTSRAIDEVSAFGGIVALNREVEASVARALAETFLEAVIAPGYTAEAREILGAKRNLRLLEARNWGADARSVPSMELRSVSGGLLVQDRDAVEPQLEWKVVTRRSPTGAEAAALRFAWRVCKHVKSNAIVFSNAERLLAAGGGQTSRVESAKIAAARGGTALRGSVVASDAFFPFRDGLDEVARAGATAVIQPGGSMRDAEVIAAADEAGLAMVFTGVRHFRH